MSTSTEISVSASTETPVAPPVIFRLFPILSSIEVWGFGFTGLLLWIMSVPGAHAGLGPQAMLLWLPITVVGVMINLQVRQMAAHWPDMAGGTPNYTSRLFKNSWFGRYAAMAYFQGWASVPTVSAIILADITQQNLATLGISFPEWILKVAFTLLAFIIAFAGTRALSVLHLCFVVPAVGFLLLFCLQGTSWLILSPASPGIFPDHWGQFNFTEWAKWYFVATYAVYAVETSSSFMADARKPATILRCLKTATWAMPVVFILGSWVVMRLSTGVETYHDNVYQNLVQAALPFWGGYANLMIIFFIASASLLSCATGCANSPRVVYQLAVDGHAAPVLGIASRRNVPGPALVLTLIIALVFLLWGDMTRVLMVTGTGYFVIFIFMHLGLWLNRGKPYARWPWWSLAFFVAELIIFMVGGIAWGWQDFLMGILFPVGVMGADVLLRHFPVGLFNPNWWKKLYTPRPHGQVQEGMASQVSLLILFVCGAAAIGWGLSGLLDGVRGTTTAVNLFAILILVIAFLGVAAACWTTLPKLALVEDARVQAVAEAQHLLRTALDAILVVGAHGIVRLANPAAENVFMLPQERLQGRHLNELIPGVDEAIAKGEKRSEHTLIQADGSLRTVEVAMADISDGQMNERSIILHDVTERKQAAEKLEQFSEHLEHSNRELEDFASVAAHDLQEPLRKIMAFGERLEDTCADTLSVEGRDYLQRMRNAARRMQALITDLLTLSRVTTRGQPFVKVDLNQIAKEVLSDLEIAIEKHQAKIELQDLPTIAADPMQMRQLLQNLIGNALKFKGETAPLVKIYAAVKPGSGTCQIMVADNGIGFDEKYLDRIFTAFERLHGREVYEGTGIGLAVCRKIAERHNGNITAKSSPGMGATFIVTLPVIQLTGEQA